MGELETVAGAGAGAADMGASRGFLGGFSGFKKTWVRLLLTLLVQAQIPNFLRPQIRRRERRCWSGCGGG